MVILNIPYRRTVSIADELITAESCAQQFDFVLSTGRNDEPIVRVSDRRCCPVGCERGVLRDIGRGFAAADSRQQPASPCDRLCALTS